MINAVYKYFFQGNMMLCIVDNNTFEFCKKDIQEDVNSDH